MNPITLALTHFNRASLLLECVQHIMDDARIGEIVISDDASTDGSYTKLRAWAVDHPKVKLYRNQINLDCYVNKARAVQLSSSSFVILFDSDNILPTKYVDTLFALPEWNEDTIYCPEFAEPHFDYTAFSGETMTRKNIAYFMKHPRCSTALNTCNFFVQRETYLGAFDGQVNPHTADSIYMAYKFLSQDRRMMFVPGLRYFHRVHAGSHYKQNVHKTGNFAKIIEANLKQLK